MIALDTNVLVRFVVEDNAAETRRAQKFIEQATSARLRLFVSEIVLCELVWVLRVSYRQPKSQVLEVLEKLLRSRQLLFVSTDRVSAALHNYAKGKGDFADYLIRENGLEAGCESVVTFDGDLLKERGFIAP